VIDLGAELRGAGLSGLFHCTRRVDLDVWMRDQRGARG